MENVYVRLGLYVLSTAIAALPAYLAGLIVYDVAADLLTVKPLALATSLIGGSVLSGGIFAKWGKK